MLIFLPQIWWLLPTGEEKGLFQGKRWFFFLLLHMHCFLFFHLLGIESGDQNCFRKCQQYSCMWKSIWRGINGNVSFTVFYSKNLKIPYFSITSHICIFWGWELYIHRHRHKHTQMPCFEIKRKETPTAVRVLKHRNSFVTSKRARQTAEQ